MKKYEILLSSIQAVLEDQCKIERKVNGCEL